MRPFQLDIAQIAVDELRRRLTDTRWPDELPEVGWTRGVPLRHLQALVRHWRDGYDWRAAERRINAYPQFITDIDGQRLHFFHVRSPEPGATPLLISHGWPGLNIEFLDLIGPLTDPVRHGGSAADAFHVVLPALPGFGFSNPVTEIGWNVPRMARAFSTLRAELGYDRTSGRGVASNMAVR